MRISWLRTPQGLPTLPHLTARSPSTFLPRLIEKVLMMAHLAIPTQDGFNLASIARPISMFSTQFAVGLPKLSLQRDRSIAVG
jgi:hypothetical protein